MTTPFKYVHTGGDCLPYLQTSASPGAEAAGFLWHLTCLLTILGKGKIAIGVADVLCFPDTYIHTYMMGDQLTPCMYVIASG